jgi:hypothetical protein
MIAFVPKELKIQILFLHKKKSSAIDAKNNFTSIVWAIIHKIKNIFNVGFAF